MMTGSRVTGDCYSDRDWLPVDTQCTLDLLEAVLHMGLKLRM